MAVFGTDRSEYSPEYGRCGYAGETDSERFHCGGNQTVKSEGIFCFREQEDYQEGLTIFPLTVQ